MENFFFLPILVLALSSSAQQWVQPLASGDYSRIEEWNRKLREFANTRVFNEPTERITFPSGSVAIHDLEATRTTGVNEVSWAASPGTNVSMFFVEYSRDNINFERVGDVGQYRTENGNRYVYKHPFNDNSLVYYRVAVVNKNGMVAAFSPSVQLADAEYRTRIFPTVVQNSQFHVQIGQDQPYEKLQVTNSLGQSVYEKGIHDVTGTITIGLPSLPAGTYFVRLLSDKRQPEIQKIMIQ
jgi:hypothetical protein